MRPSTPRSGGGARKRPEAQSEQPRPQDAPSLTGSAASVHLVRGALPSLRRGGEAGRPLPHPIREAWCRWCTSVYAENAPAVDGRVYCGGADWTEGDDGCGRAFPNLARLIEWAAEAGERARYRKYCRECREELAAEAAEFRALDAAVGVGAVVANANPRPAPGPARYRTWPATAVDAEPTRHRRERETTCAPAAGSARARPGPTDLAAVRRRRDGVAGRPGPDAWSSDMVEAST